MDGEEADCRKKVNVILTLLRGRLKQDDKVLTLTK